MKVSATRHFLSNKRARDTDTNEDLGVLSAASRFLLVFLLCLVKRAVCRSQGGVLANPFRNLAACHALCCVNDIWMQGCRAWQFEFAAVDLLCKDDMFRKRRHADKVAPKTRLTRPTERTVSGRQPYTPRALPAFRFGHSVALTELDASQEERGKRGSRENQKGMRARFGKDNHCIQPPLSPHSIVDCGYCLAQKNS